MSRYEAEHVKNILHLSDQFNLQFELDWLLCGNLFIVPFEVSVATKVENVATVLDNKLRQVIEKIVPKMKLILFTIFKHRFSAENSQNDDSNLGIMFEEFLRNRFRAVIYIPDCCSEDIQEALHSKVSKSKNRKRNQCLQDIMEKAEKCGTLNLIEILTHEKSDVSQLHLYSLDSNLNLHKSELAMEQIFSPDSRTAMSSENEEAAIFNYMSAILCLSFLMIGNPLMSDPLDIDTRYQCTKLSSVERARFDQCRKMVPGDGEGTFPKLILSPQQCNILTEDGQFFCFLGEPGSGKTLVLLAKALIEANNVETQYVFFVMPETRTEFSNVVHKFFDDHLESSAMRDKVKILLVDEFGFASLAEEIKRKW